MGLDETDPPTRAVGPAMWRGLKCRCPNCGQGWLFRRYIEQVEHCAVCGTPLAQYNVGLLLPLIVITVVIFIIAFVMLYLEINGWGNPLVYLMVLVPLSVIVPLMILPSSKGAIIGLFWARGWSDEQEQ